MTPTLSLQLVYLQNLTFSTCKSLSYQFHTFYRNGTWAKCYLCSPWKKIKWVCNLAWKYNRVLNCIFWLRKPAKIFSASVNGTLLEELVFCCVCSCIITGDLISSMCVFSHLSSNSEIHMQIRVNGGTTYKLSYSLRDFTLPLTEMK